MNAADWIGRGGDEHAAAASDLPEKWSGGK